jgi:3-hydroxy-3-methylglutaryl CoA synthase
MDGAEIFTFTLREVPPLVKATLQAKGWSLDDVDAFVFHQANAYILNYLARRIKIPTDKFIGSSSFGVDLMYTGMKSTPNDGRRHEQSGYDHLRARVAGTMGNRRPGTGHGNDTP